MLNVIAPVRLVGYWFAAVALVAAAVIAMGVPIGAGTAALLLTMCLVPPVILLVVWRGAPPPTVGELLYSVATPKDDRP
jgi:hypothetical protein